MATIAWVLAAAMTARLGFAAAAGTFATDECFHASVSGLLLRERAWPVELPQFYSGFFYYYPPLFHALGALWIACFGTPALHLLPAAIYGGLFAVLALGGRRSAPAGSLAATALIFASHPSFLTHGTRLYVEGFSALLGLAATLALVSWWRAPSLRRAVGLGLLVGLGILTKLTLLLMLLLVAGAAVAAALGGRTRPAPADSTGTPHIPRRPARQLVLALGIGAALGAIMLVRNQVLYGSAFYPSRAPDLDRELSALNLARFSTPPAAFYAGLPTALGPVLGGALLAALAAFARRPRFGIWEAALGFAIVSLLVIPLVPYVQSRHLLPFLAVAALASLAMIFERLNDHTTLRTLALTALFIPALLAQLSFQDPRKALDLDAHLKKAFPQIKTQLRPNDLVLSLWTYDTAYYTGARATWPNPWGQRPERRPVAMFQETDSKRFVLELRERGITHVLMPSGVAEAEFNSANYPKSFVRCINESVRAGALRPVWTGEGVVLIGVPPA